MTTQNKSVMAFNLSYMFNETKLLQEFLKTFINGYLMNQLSCLMWRKNVGKAHGDLESGNTIGKLILLTRGNKESALETGKI